MNDLSNLFCRGRLSDTGCVEAKHPAVLLVVGSDAFGASVFFEKIADFVTPGSMIASRIPNGATSSASSSLTPSSAHFEAT